MSQESGRGPPSGALKQLFGLPKKVHPGWNHVGESCPHFPHSQSGGHRKCLLYSRKQDRALSGHM